MPIDIDIHPVTCSVGPTQHFDVRFLIAAPAGRPEKVSAESHELGWFAPDVLPEPLAAATGRVVDAALARLNGRHPNS